MAMTAMDAYSVHELDVYRANLGVQPLGIDGAIYAAAQEHSQWLLDHDVFVHSNPRTDALNNGFVERPGNFGYFQNHEFESGQVPFGNQQAVADLFLAGYASSPDHLATMVRPDLQLVGISNKAGEFAGNPQSWVNTQDFAYNERAQFVLGFVYNDANHNKKYDIGEGSAGVGVHLKNNATGAQIDLVTDANGYYGVEVGTGEFSVWTGSSNYQPGVYVNTNYLGKSNVMVDFASGFGFPEPSAYNGLHNWWHPI